MVHFPCHCYQCGLRLDTQPHAIEATCPYSRAIWKHADVRADGLSRSIHFYDFGDYCDLQCAECNQVSTQNFGSEGSFALHDVLVYFCDDVCVHRVGMDASRVRDYHDLSPCVAYQLEVDRVQCC